MRKPKRRATMVKYRAIQDRFRQLHEEERMRTDDVIAHLCQEFFISNPNTIYNILATPVDDLEEDEENA